MPEKWEHELRKLRDVEQPSTLEDRVADGPHPHHEPGRPTRERVAAAIVAFAVCAAVGVVGYRTLSGDDAPGGSVATGVPSADEPLVLELTSDDVTPTATLWFENAGQDGVLESYNWCPDGTTGGASCTSGIADFAIYPPVNEFLVVPPGTPIEVVGDGTVEELTFQDPGGGAVPGSSSSVVPDDDGRYAIELRATWPKGDALVWFGVQVLSSEAAAPDVLTVDCSLGLVQTDTSVVRTNPDGLHIRFTGSDGARAFEILSPDGQTYAVGGEATGDVRPTLPTDPGSWAVGCGRDVDLADAVPFELVDSDDHHAPEQLACGEMPQTGFTSSVPSDVPHDEAIGELLWNLADGDRIRGAGYGADLWHLGVTYVVDRGGDAVVRVVLAEERGTWSGTFETCPDSGITLSQAIVATIGGATGPEVTGSGATGATATTGGGATGASGAVEPSVSDELIARCEGLGPALDVGQVVAQPDGVHLEVTNVADAEIVLIEDADGELLAGTFAEATERFVVELDPGVYWLGCRVLNEVGEVDGNHLDHPEAYVEFEVLPAAA